MHANVAGLLRALGSVKRPLSYGDLAALLNERDAGRKRYPSTIQKWIEGVVPDLPSIKVMAELAGVSFEDFALGARGETPYVKTETLARAVAESSAPLEPKDVPVPRPARKPAEKKDRAS